MKKLCVFLCILLTLALFGCEKAPAEQTVPTTVPVEATAPIETTPPTTLPPETTPPTEPVASTITWQAETAKLYHLEDYFLFERFFQSDGEFLKEVITTEDASFRPRVKDGILMLAGSGGAPTFQVGDESYESLHIYGTDGVRWIYCLDANRVLFRIDPLGNKEIIFEDPQQRIASGMFKETFANFVVIDQGNLLYFTAGAEQGYGLYRCHLPSGTVDLLAQAEDPISMFGTVSNYQVRYFIGPYLGGEEIIHTTPAKQWDLSDPNIAIFQKLLAPSTNGSLNAMNNWYNMATFLVFDHPEAISINALMSAGFRDLSTKPTGQELDALPELNPNKHYFKLPVSRIDRVLTLLTGLTLDALERNTLAEAENVLYDQSANIYYKPCLLHENDFGQMEIYIYKQEITVHKVEPQDDNTFRVFYLPQTPYPFSSAMDWTEKVMVLKKADNGWHILSNGPALTPATE